MKQISINIPDNNTEVSAVAVYALMAGDGTPQGWRLVWFYNSYEEADKHVPKDNSSGFPTKWIVQPMSIAEALNKLAVSLLRGERISESKIFNAADSSS